MSRQPRRITIDIADVLAADASLAAADAQWRAQGYARTSCRMWRRTDGTYTARLVWRNRDSALSTITFSVQGLVLA